ncbi:MAG: ABC transporter substrate-binding protein [Candidatus Baldrarchaeia archaeon]
MRKKITSSILLLIIMGLVFSALPAKVAYMQEGKEIKIPDPVKNLPDIYSDYVVTEEEARLRYNTTLLWMDEHGHAVISNGPFYLDYWDPKSISAVFKAYRDPTYPFTADYWVNELLDKQITDKRPGPPLDQINLYVRTDQSIGIQDTAEGELDVFLWSSPPSVYEGIPEETVEKLQFIRAATGYWSLVFNPVSNVYYKDGKYAVFPNATAGDDWKLVPGLVNASDIESYTGTKGIYFNPLAIRGVRYAMNWLINRKYIIDSILAGGGLPMYSPVQPSEPANKYFNQTYEDLGLTGTGNKEKAINMITDSLLATNDTMFTVTNGDYYLVNITNSDSPVGWWWGLHKPDGSEEPVELNFFIRIEDERLEEGRYIADLIEEAGLKVNRLERDRVTCILASYYTDPADYEWSIYTEGWVSMEEWLYPEWSIAQMYAPWYANMPGWQEVAAGWWQYLNNTIDNVANRSVYGPVANETEYWNTLVETVKLGIDQSVRIFIAETWEYFPVNKRVENIAAGIISGLWPAWPLRTANTSDGILNVAEFSAEGALFMSAFNPVLGMEDVYTELIWRYLHDYADYPHPVTGEPIPMRNTWQVVKGGEEGVTVPSDKAIFYNATTNTWEFVPDGTNSSVKVIYNIKLSNWHHGLPMTITDILNEFAFMWEWTTEDYPGDPYYSSKYASRVGPTISKVKGIEIINETAVAIYGDYCHAVSDAVTADFYAPFAVLPWEVWAAMEELVAKGGPKSGEAYTWSQVEGKRWIDLLKESHVEDLMAALEGFGGELPRRLAFPMWGYYVAIGVTVVVIVAVAAVYFRRKPT